MLNGIMASPEFESIFISQKYLKINSGVTLWLFYKKFQSIKKLTGEEGRWRMPTLSLVQQSYPFSTPKPHGA